MTRKQNLAAVLATTASVALLAGTAQAQNGPSASGVSYCSSTQMSPAFNNCVMPAASAPGGGSFPGSFLVPGTNTSFAVHGIIFFNVYHSFGPAIYDGALSPLPATNGALQGPGIAGGTGLNAHAMNGGTDMDAGPTRPNIETRTPTGFGELKTYIEMDFGITGNKSQGAGGAYTEGTAVSGQPAGNEDSVRLRQAYGTLGPWLMGQTKTLVDDVQAYPDLADAGLDAGMRTSTIVHKPQIRYTWLGGNGLTVAGSAEMPTATSSAIFSQGGGLATILGDNNGNINTASAPTIGGTAAGSSIEQIPDLAAAAQWDQPWGHLRFAGMYHDSRLDFAGVPSTAAGSAFSNIPLNGYRNESAGFFLHLSGHINTWGKDALRGGVSYDDGVAEANSAFTNDRLLELGTTGGNGMFRENERAVDVYVSYEHFFSDQWRSNISGGYDRFLQAQLPFGNTAAATGLPLINWTTHLNVIYSPVPQTDFILEWQHATVTTYAGDSGRADRLFGQFKFYF